MFGPLDTRESPPQTRAASSNGTLIRLSSAYKIPPPRVIVWGLTSCPLCLSRRYNMDCPVLRSAQTLLLGVILSALGLFGILSVEAAQAQPQGVPDTLRFERATTLLLDHNPQLQADRARVQAESRAAQADALFPNATLRASEEHTPLPGDGADDEWFLSLTQPLKYPGEHRARQRGHGSRANAKFPAN